MRQALDQFQRNVDGVRALAGVVTSIKTMTTSAVDLSDVMRAELVLAVSALDHFIHEVARCGMLEVHRGNRPPTDAYQAFRIPLGAVRTGLSDLTRDDWLDSAIRQAQSLSTFQRPDNIADALRLISPVKLWDEVAKQLGLASAEVKRRLQLVVDRRNKIAHEADLDPLNPGVRWPIDEQMVDDAITFIHSLGLAIHKVIEGPTGVKSKRLLLDAFLGLLANRLEDAKRRTL